MIVLGLTGSIGMGKSTTARMFEDAGVPVHDSDATVHKLYAGPAAPLVEEAFPGTVRDGVVDRGLLGSRVLGDKSALARLEAIIHPLVRAEADAFLEQNRKTGAPVIVLDIPLLFETGGRDRVDRVLVVTADAAIQRDRVLSRPGMTPERFEAILASQVPDATKRAAADYVIDTGLGLDHARHAVASVLDDLAGEKPVR
jgi:dephospho-CoA kinase